MASLQRREARSSICFARSRASRMIASARCVASARSFWPFSAAARPSAIFLERSASVWATIGVTNFEMNQRRSRKTMICPMKVALIVMT